MQDVLREQLSEKAVEVLHKNAGHLYVCGGMNMARDVACTLQDILASKTGMAIAEAGEYLERMKVSSQNAFRLISFDLHMNCLVTSELMPSSFIYLFLAG